MLKIMANAKKRAGEKAAKRTTKALSHKIREEKLATKDPVKEAARITGEAGKGEWAPLITTVLTGAGSVENGWVPVKAALRREIEQFPEREPSLVFAVLVHNLRWLTFQKQKRDERSFQKACDLFDRQHKIYTKLKESICEEFTRACKSRFVRLRPEFHRISRFFSEDLAFITTNWDLCLQHEYPGKTIHPLHGYIQEPGTLYLPTEAIVEPYRGPPESEWHGRVAGDAMKRLEVTERLIIYGLSLSPLDPELGIVISEGFYGTANLPKEVVIVDLDPQAIAERLRFYLRRPLEPFCYRPGELSA